MAEAGSIATWLAVGSAILAAANVALKPDDLRDRHKRAADQYGRLQREVAAFIGRELSQSVDGSRLDSLWGRFEGFRGTIAEIGDATPNVVRALEKRERSSDLDHD